METLLKGCFSLLAIKSPVVALKISNCNINCFFKIFDQVIMREKSRKPKDMSSAEIDFKKVFNYLFETVRGLLIYAKEGKFDQMFMEEGLIPQLCYVISKCFIEHGNPLLCNMLGKEVAGKVVADDARVLDLLNYTIGTIKCFTQSNNEVQVESVNNKMVPLLSLTISKVLEFNCATQRKAMILVQITGTLRNLANVELCQTQIAQSAIVKLCDIFFDPQFNQGKELILNIARLLSKVSLEISCADKIVKTGHVKGFLGAMVQHRDSSAILIRLAYILGNLTTNFEEARVKLCRKKADEKSCFLTITELACFYLDKDAKGDTVAEAEKSANKNTKYQEFTTGHLEDALTKIIKLLANLSTEESVAYEEFHQIRDLLNKFIEQLCLAVNRRTIEENEEFVLNAVSCITNILYYDTAQKPLLTPDLRGTVFNCVKNFLLATQNEEIQIETVRVLSNLSRHSQLCEELFTGDKEFLQMLVIVLDHTLRDLVFYSVGIIINMSLHERVRPSLLEMKVVDKLIDVLKDANLEDMELAKVAAKAIHNL